MRSEWLKRVLIGTACMLLAACGDDAKPTADEPILEAEFCSRLIGELCRGIQSCCSDITRAYPTHDACVESQITPCTTRLQSLANSGMVYDPELGRAAVDRMQEDADACRPTLGVRAVEGIAKPGVSAGGSCLVTDACIDDTLICRTMGESDTRTCAAAEVEGGPCFFNSDCISGLYCRDHLQCAAKLADGSPCITAPAQECLHQCVSTGVGDEMVCAPLFDNGHACFAHEDCASQHCDESYCAACATDLDCNPFACVDGACDRTLHRPAVDQPNGARCFQASECQSDFCGAGTCDDATPDDVYCVF